MDITPATPIGKKIITSYGSAGFKINDQLFQHNLIVHPDYVLEWLHKGNNIDLQSFSQILTGNISDIDILLVGCGHKHQQLTKDITQLFRSKGISIDIMTTGAACRTYNVLLAEGRQVGAALIAV